MKIAIISNYLTHHLSSLCESFEEENNQVVFYACEKTPKYRLAGGFEDLSSLPFVKDVRLDDIDDIDFIQNEIASFDVVIIGSGDNRLIKKRIEQNLLTFRFSEHLSKSKFFIINILRLIKWRFLLKNENICSNFYLLCSSNWAKYDYKKIGCYKNKMLKWGYFPKISNLGGSKTTENKFFWAGRFVNWKHPEFIKIAYKIIRSTDKNNFSFEIFGSGNKFQTIKVKNMIKNTTIRFRGPVSKNALHDTIHEKDIFLFTSDKGEGWGAILNEAMLKGCICIANKNAGSTLFLIKDGYNGFVYSTRKEFKKVLKKVLMLPKETLDKISNKARESIKTIWCPEQAAKNLLSQTNSILTNNKLNKNIIGPASVDGLD